MTTDSNRLSFSAPLWLALTAILAAPVLAQEPADEGVPTKPEPFRAQPEPTLSVEFRGGSLTDYVSVIRNAGDKINIVLPPLAAEVQVPPLSIIDAEVEIALEVAAEVAGEQHRVGIKTHRSKFGRPIYVIQVREVRDQVAVVGPGPAASMVRVFSLGSLTEGPPSDPERDSYPRVKAETILTAIDTGLAVAADDGAPKPLIRYHEDSGLLFVRGTPPQIGVVSEVLESIDQDVERRRGSWESQQGAPQQSEPKANGGK